MYLEEAEVLLVRAICGTAKRTLFDIIGDGSPAIALADEQAERISGLEKRIAQWLVDQKDRLDG